MIDTNQLQELAEGVILATLNGGGLAGFVFRHDDANEKTKKDQITVKAGAPEPQLEGPRGYRVEVEVEIRTSKPTRGASLHGEAMRRLASIPILHAAALTAGLTESDDLYLMDEEISGDRAETKNLRKRNIVVPLVMKVHA